MNWKSTAFSGSLVVGRRAVTPLNDRGIALKSAKYYRILRDLSEPRYSELNKVRVNDGKNAPYEGYVIESQFDKGRWNYMISITETPPSQGSWDNWVLEEWLTLTK